MRGLQKLAGAVGAAGLLHGCAMVSQPHVDVAQPTQARPAPSAYVPAQNGAIFQSSAYRPLYESHRARMVGDIVTITISEAVTASQQSTSQIEKKGSVSASVSAMAFINSSQLGKLGAGGSSDSKLNGSGSAASSNNFTGTITATVIEVLPNGHLLVSGEKQIGVTNNVDTLRFSGQIDPATIQPGNVVVSTQVANVRIEQMGRGAPAEANQIGWLARFFLNILPI